MTEKNKLIKEKLRERNFGFCEVCNKYSWTTGETAHRIAQTLTNKRIYGNGIIDHIFNKKWVCSDKSCNDKCNIGYKPAVSLRLVNLILEHGKENLPAKEIDNIIYDLGLVI